MKPGMLKAAFAALISLLMVISISFTVFAADNSENSLTLHYRYDNKAISGADVSIYHVASPSPDGTFALNGDFSKYPVQLNKYRTVEEWDALAETLRSYASLDALEPLAKRRTDDDGVALFSDLEEGIYLVVTSQIVLGDKILKFSPALLSVPSRDEDGKLVYQVNAYPKHSEHTITPEKLNFRVLKLWVHGNSAVRPESVDITILCDGERKYNVTLSEENNWSFSWQADDDGKTWSVVEESVPDNYVVDFENLNGTYIITNTYDESSTPEESHESHESHESNESEESEESEESNESEESDESEESNESNESSVSEESNNSRSEDMGDTTNIIPTALIMTVSGLFLILIGMAGRRSKTA